MKKLVIREPENLTTIGEDIINLEKKINEIIDFLNSKYPTITVNPNEGTGNSNK